jgi:hypothetical protein
VVTGEERMRTMIERYPEVETGTVRIGFALFHMLTP